MQQVENLTRFREFIQAFTDLVTNNSLREETILNKGEEMLGHLIAVDDWLPPMFALPHDDHYQQYLLYCDPLERFSVVSFVWGPGQKTPIHDHRVWGLVGVLRGLERCTEYSAGSSGSLLQKVNSHLLKCGQIDSLSPHFSDIHQVSNALQNGVSVSIHVYGTNIGSHSRFIYDIEKGNSQPFISGYSNTLLPNIWDRVVQQTESYTSVHDE